MIRKIHLLLGMFLTPRVIMYAASTVAMQHRDLFTGSAKRIEPKYEIVREEALSLGLSSNEDSRAVASRRFDCDAGGFFEFRRIYDLALRDS